MHGFAIITAQIVLGTGLQWFADFSCNNLLNHFMANVVAVLALQYEGAEAKVPHRHRLYLINIHEYKYIDS